MDSNRLRRLARAWEAKRQMLELRLAALGCEEHEAGEAMREIERSMTGPAFGALGVWQPAINRLARLEDRRQTANDGKAAVIRELAATTGLLRRNAARVSEAEAMEEAKRSMIELLELLAGAGRDKAAARPDG